MTNSSTQRILIIGAGELGTAMLEGLVGHSAPASPPSITILLRASTIDTADADKRRANKYLRSLGASLTPGDIVHDSEEHLASIFGRYDTVIVCSGFGFPSGTQLRVTRAVMRARVKRFFPWQWGIDYDIVGVASAQDCKESTILTIGFNFFWDWRFYECLEASLLMIQTVIADIKCSSI